MFKHIENEIELERGDTLVFVRFRLHWYAQQKLSSLFKDELGIDVYGCYLIALPVANWKSTRSGLLDITWCDERQLTMLISYIALLEQLCNSPDQSIIDFDDNGQPVYSEVSVSTDQHNKLKQIHQECVRFVNDAKDFFSKVPCSIEMLRDIALAEISRLLFLPTKQELNYLKTFAFDLNLGTSDLLTIFNEAEGLAGLKKRGLLFMEKNLGTMRTNYPAELRSAGLELAFTLMASQRFGINIKCKILAFVRKRSPSKRTEMQKAYKP